MNFKAFTDTVRHILRHYRPYAKHIKPERSVAWDIDGLLGQGVKKYTAETTYVWAERRARAL